MKIVAATPAIPSMTREEAEGFLESKLNLQLATLDEQGEPNIQPVWFYYDQNREKLHLNQQRKLKISGINLLFIFPLMMRIFRTGVLKGRVL